RRTDEVVALGRTGAAAPRTVRLPVPIWMLEERGGFDGNSQEGGEKESGGAQSGREAIREASGRAWEWAADVRNARVRQSQRSDVREAGGGARGASGFRTGRDPGPCTGRPGDNREAVPEPGAREPVRAVAGGTQARGRGERFPEPGDG